MEYKILVVIGILWVAGWVILQYSSGLCAIYDARGQKTDTEQNVKAQTSQTNIT